MISFSLDPVYLQVGVPALAVGSGRGIGEGDS
jgi:hypothetical protein